MNYPILKAATNVRLLRTHPRGRGSVKIEQGLRRQEYATLFWECNNERKSFIKGTGAWASNTTIKTPTTDVSRRPRANLHQSSPGLPPLENCLLREGLNEPPNSQRCNQCGIITHTQGGESVLKWNNIHANGNMPLLLRTAVRKGKASKWEP